MKELAKKALIVSGAIVLIVLISVASNITYSKYLKKIYVIDYTRIINQYKSEIEAAVIRGDQFYAQIKVKQLQQVATETDAFCKQTAQKNGIEIYAANLIFAPSGKVVDLTPDMISYLQEKKLLEAEKNASK